MRTDVCRVLTCALYSGRNVLPRTAVIVASMQQRRLCGLASLVLARRATSTFAPLSSIVHVEKLQQESPKSIKKAWMRHHHKRDCIGAVLEAPSYDKLMARTLESPMFVFPMPKDKVRRCAISAAHFKPLISALVGLLVDAVSGPRQRALVHRAGGVQA